MGFDVDTVAYEKYADKITNPFWDAFLMGFRLGAEDYAQYLKKLESELGQK